MCERDESLPVMFVCHCSMCPQKDRYGGDFAGGAPWAAVKRVSIWTGNIARKRTSEFATRGLCGACGAGLFIRYDCEANTDWVHARVFPEDALADVPSKHIHCAQPLAGRESYKGFEPWEPDICRPAGTPAPDVCTRCFQIRCRCNEGRPPSAVEEQEDEQEQSEEEEEEEEERHLSEVHIDAPPVADGVDEATATCTTSFVYRKAAKARSPDETEYEEAAAAVEADADGDLILPRKRKRPSANGGHGVLTISHRLGTPLNDVGLQVWRGAILLSDWLLSRTDRTDDEVILDLGAGCGLTSLAASAAGAKTVFCTDHLPSILTNAARCVAINASKGHVCSFPNAASGTGIQIRTLKWDDHGVPYSSSDAVMGLLSNGGGSPIRKTTLPPLQRTSSGSVTADDVYAIARQMSENAASSSSCSSLSSSYTSATEVVIKTDLDDPYRWRPSDGAILSKCSLILAADCVYDDQATASLVELLRRILPKLSEGAMAMIALERRVNFCLEGLKARAANAECFEAAIRKLAAAGEWLVEKMDASKVPQVIEGGRREGADLELWKVTVARPGTPPARVTYATENRR